MTRAEAIARWECSTVGRAMGASRAQRRTLTERLDAAVAGDTVAVAAISDASTVTRMAAADLLAAAGARPWSPTGLVRLRRRTRSRPPTTT